ncbi:MAG: hypothetical protein Ct9H300mP1_22770 [Planctomycetaceae bacterium]|nr:MAG: hypothetical protein Ct9H300mP1_22770 [Planctomycetaceae bacterium]
MTAGQFAEAVRLSRKLMAQVAFRQLSPIGPGGRPENGGDGPRGSLSPMTVTS